MKVNPFSSSNSEGEFLELEAGCACKLGGKRAVVAERLGSPRKLSREGGGTKVKLEGWPGIMAKKVVGSGVDLANIDAAWGSDPKVGMAR